MNDLIQTAKMLGSKQKRRPLDRATRELAMAWARGEVTLSGVQKALKLKESQYPTGYSILARALQKHIQINKL